MITGKGELMKASRSPRIQAIAEYLEARYALLHPTEQINDTNWNEMVTASSGEDETFNFAWLKITPYERNYLRRKVGNQVSKRLTSAK